MTWAVRYVVAPGARPCGRRPGLINGKTLDLPSQRRRLIVPAPVRAMTDRRLHAGRQHHERGMAMPAMAGTDLMVIEVRFGLGRLDFILNARMPVRGDQGLNPAARQTSGRGPGGIMSDHQSAAGRRGALWSSACQRL
jgi:hypothetical protein